MTKRRLGSTVSAGSIVMLFYLFVIILLWLFALFLLLMPDPLISATSRLRGLWFLLFFLALVGLVGLVVWLLVKSDRDSRRVDGLAVELRRGPLVLARIQPSRPQDFVFAFRVVRDPTEGPELQEVDRRTPIGAAVFHARRADLDVRLTTDGVWWETLGLGKSRPIGQGLALVVSDTRAAPVSSSTPPPPPAKPPAGFAPIGGPDENLKEPDTQQQDPVAEQIRPKLAAFDERHAQLDAQGRSATARIVVASENAARVGHLLRVLTSDLARHGYRVVDDRDLSSEPYHVHARLLQRPDGQFESIIVSAVVTAAEEIEGGPDDGTSAAVGSHVVHTPSSRLSTLFTEAGLYYRCSACGEGPPGRKVFIGHGGRGGETAWPKVREILTADALPFVEYESPTKPYGRHAQNRLYEMLRDSGAAVMLMTPEDEQSDGGMRARENVVHEIGLLHGHLGYENVIIVRDPQVAQFSNIAGITTLEHSFAGPLVGDVLQLPKYLRLMLRMPD